MKLEIEELQKANEKLNFELQSLNEGMSQVKNLNDQLEIQKQQHEQEKVNMKEGF